MIRYAFLILLTCTGSALADIGSKLVTDLAEIVPQELELQIRAQSEEAFARIQAPIGLVTLPRLPVNQFGGLDEYASFVLETTALQESERATRNWGYGALFVVLRDERECEIHLSPNWNDSQRQTVHSLLEEKIRPAVSDGRFEEAIEVGFTALAELSGEVQTRHPPYWQIFKQTEVAALLNLFLSATSLSWKNPLLYTGALYAVIVLLESLFPWRPRQSRWRPMLALDVTYTLLHYVLFWGLCGAAIGTVANVAFNDFLYFATGTTNLLAIHLGRLPVWLQLVLLVLFTEFNSYWVHRLLHGSDLLWEIHKVHHSARHIDIFNAARLHFLEPLTYKTLTYVPAVMVGFGVKQTFLIGLATSFFCAFTHANCRLRLGPLKYIINSPELHIWHHARGTHERGNCNFGAFLSVWDFVFGTAYIPEKLNPSPPLAFEGVEDYPTGYFSQLIAPFPGMFAVVKRRILQLAGWNSTAQAESSD